MDAKHMKFYIILILGLFILYLAYKLILPFLVPVFAAIVVAILIYPLYQRMNKRFKHKTINAIILIVILFLVVGIPMFFVLNALVKDVFVTYITAKQNLLSGDIFPTACEKSFFCDVSQEINSYLRKPETRYYIQEAGNKIQTYLVTHGSNLIFSIPSRIIDIFIFIVLLFYFMKDGAKFIEYTKKLLPMDRRHQEHLVKKSRDTIYGVLYGQFLTAFIQGAIGAIIFYILGISAPIFWGVVMMFVSIIPVGTWIVWLPASFSLIFEGITASNNVMIWKGGILLILGVFIISTVDNFIKPFLIGSKVKIHTALIIIGIFGGLKLFGIIGIFIGPMILTLLLAFFDIYRESRIDDKPEKKIRKKPKKKSRK
ncbi:AI-2E family transporter [Candidatus Woesearchaeota archaeon]|nr:AI-2E family transporter [Candidatus Woesearchaeota archaeon]